MIYYAAVCGALAVTTPRLRSALARLAIGMLVGLAAAGLLPILRRWLGLG